jgi:hypothetical protein
MNAQRTHHRSRPLLMWSTIIGLAGCGGDGCGSAGDDGDTDGDAYACGAGLVPGDLVITEIMADPPGADSGREWLEIHNASAGDVELAGALLLYSRQDGSSSKVHMVARSWVLPPGGYGVAGALIDEDQVLAVVPYVDYGYAQDLGDMGNSDGRLVVACDDEVIDEAIYTEPTDGASRGYSGDRLPDAMGNDDLALWCDAITALDAESLGTPGEQNDICLGSGGPVSCLDPGTDEVRAAVPPTLGDVVISEIMSNPVGDSNAEEGREWFEVYSTSAFDLNGLALGKDLDLSDAAPIAVNECLPVAAGTRIVFGQSMDPAINGGLPQVDVLFDFSINQSSAQLVLSYQGMLLDEYPYGTTDDGVAWNLDPDFHTVEGNDVAGFSCDATAPYGDGDLGTPGAPNSECEGIVPPAGQCFEDGVLRDVVPPAAVGDLVITEVMPNPHGPEMMPVDDADGEWIEILANAPFDLAGLAVARLDGSQAGVVETADGECMQLAAGDYLVIARSDDPTLNGDLPRVDGTFDFDLRVDEGLGVGMVAETTELADAITWTSATAGIALSLDPTATDPLANDDEAAFCDATAPYGSGDLGTPGEQNPSCGTIPSGTCLDGGVERRVVVPQLGDLVITEIMPNPAAVGDTAGEWFELLATASVDLHGLELGDDPTAPDDTLLPEDGDCLAVSAGERVVVARNDVPATNGGLPPVILATFTLTNGSSTLSVGIGGQALDTVTWAASTEGAAWTVDPAAEDPAGNDDLTSWCVATDPYGTGVPPDLGTPGTQGPACGGMTGMGMCLDGGVPRAIDYPTAGDLVITEWMPNPSGTDTDSEWFEVYVGADVDLNELQLSRYTLATGVFQLQATLGSPNCMTVPAGSYVLFARDLDPLVNGGLPPVDHEIGFGLNNSDAGLAVGVADVHLDEVQWAGSTDGSATQLDPGTLTPAANDVPGNLCLATTPYGAGGNGTPGMANPSC